ncbi:MAG TPA: chemotaxis protein CheW [Clostridia bacterium]|nr:chemotaxis protein CheW [Clostridia bacterium]
MEKQCVIFKLAGAEYGINVLNVQEIIRPLKLVKLPNSPDYVLGICELRENIIPVIDLKQVLNLGKVKESKAARIIVIQEAGEMLGLLVDEVGEVLRINQEKIKREAKLAKKYIRGIAKIDGRLIMFLNLAAII